MERLTVDKDVSEMGMFELAHNSCYAKDGKARYRDYDLDIDARELTRKLLKDHADGDDSFTDDEDFDDWMMDYLQDGMDSIEGLIALFYRNLWAMADLRERLAEYEDLEEQNRLLKLPYAINDTVYYLDDITPFEEMPVEGRISGFRVTWCRTIVMHITTNFNDEGCLADRNEDIDVVAEEFGKTVFLTREEAEAALKELRRGKHERAGKDLDSG